MMRSAGRVRGCAPVVAAVMLLAAGAPGCETTRAVGPAPSPDSIASINDAGRGRDLEVQYRPIALAPPPLGAARKRLVEADNASIAGADASTVTFVKRDGSQQAIATPLIRTVSVTNRGRGALYGSLIGGAAGLLLGVVAVLADPPCQDGGICLFDTNDVIVPIALTTGLLGALIGGGGGALVGHRTTFVFDESR
jgi:hypothetical protein